MGRARKGWVRLKGGTWYVGLTLRSGRSFERQVPAPSDGLPIDANYLALVRSELVRSIFDVCQRALDEAVEDGLLSVNPFRSPRSRNALPEKEHKDPGALARWCYSRRDVER